MILPIVIAVVGLVIGSFLNVCIYRIPLEKSIVWPGSSCTQCGSRIHAWDNIPVISYLWLGGKCRYCSSRISVRYPVVELLSGLFAVSLLYCYGPTPSFVIYYALSCALLVVTFIDLDYQIIPDRISIGGIIVGLVCVHWLPVTYADSLIGLALGSGSLLLIIYGYYFLTRKQGMGGGDVKLLGMIGVFLGWQGVVFTIFAASLIGSIVGISLLWAQKKDMKTAIPFGPFLSLGAMIYLLWGNVLIDWYLGLMNP